MTNDNTFDKKNPIIHKFLSAKGGRVRTKKGLATLSPERRKEIASLGGKAKHANRNSRTNSESEEQQSNYSVQASTVGG